MRKVVALSILFLVGCDYYDRRFEVINQTKSEITVETYSDTVPNLPSVGKTEFYLANRILREDSAKLTAIGKNGWPFVIARSKNKKLNLMVYNVDSLRKYHSIDTLIKNRIYKRYEFSEDEMRGKNWKVTLK